MILDCNLIADSKCYHNRYRLQDIESGSLFTDVLEIHAMELRKLPGAPAGENDDLYYWLKFIRADRKEEFEMTVTQAKRAKIPEIGKAYAVLKRLSADEQTRLEYEYRERARLDEQARMEYASAQGEHNKAVEMAKKMLARGMEPDVIADLADLPLDEVLSLQSK